MLRRRVARKIWVPTLKVKVTARHCSKIQSGPWLCYLKSFVKNISQKWSPYCEDVSRVIFGSLPWRSRSQHDLAAKSCPAHNFVIWSQILQLFYIIDHHIDTTCHAQYLGCYLEGQGHSTVSGPTFCYLKSEFTTTFDKLLLCVQYLFGEHYPVPTGSCLFCDGCAPFRTVKYFKVNVFWLNCT